MSVFLVQEDGGQFREHLRIGEAVYSQPVPHRLRLHPVGPGLVSVGAFPLKINEELEVLVCGYFQLNTEDLLFI